MSRKDLVRDLTLVLLYLNSWVEGDYHDEAGTVVEVRRAWRGASWDALDELRDTGLVDFSNRAKSAYVTPSGVQQALLLLDELGLSARMGDEAPDADVVAVPSAKPAKHSGADKPVPAFTFRLAFRFIELTCWRELRVPKTLTFEDFHTAIQACFSWLNYHLYDFQLNSRGIDYHISWPDFETGGSPLNNAWSIPGEPRRTWVDAAQMRLDEVFPRTRKALYSYDYGDGWELDVRLVDSKTPLDGSVSVCVAGEGDCPPDDVGGEGGFIGFLRVIGDYADEEHEWMVAWGEGQGFEHFDITRTNERLAHYDDWRVKGVYDGR